MSYHCCVSRTAREVATLKTRLAEKDAQLLAGYGSTRPPDSVALSQGTFFNMQTLGRRSPTNRSASPEPYGTTRPLVSWGTRLPPFSPEPLPDYQGTSQDTGLYRQPGSVNNAGSPSTTSPASMAHPWGKQTLELRTSPSIPAPANIGRLHERPDEGHHPLDVGLNPGGQMEALLPNVHRGKSGNATVSPTHETPRGVLEGQHVPGPETRPMPSALPSQPRPPETDPATGALTLPPRPPDPTFESSGQHLRGDDLRTEKNSDTGSGSQTESDSSDTDASSGKSESSGSDSEDDESSSSMSDVDTENQEPRSRLPLNPKQEATGTIQSKAAPQAKGWRRARWIL
jgi:hypothetical protein